MTRREKLTRRLGYNKFRSGIFTGVVIFLAFLVFVPLLSVLSFIFVKGVGNVNLNLFFSDQRNNGILNALVGSGEMVIVAIVISVPIGIASGIYLSEAQRSKVAETLRIMVDVFQGIPSIVVGIVAYIWLVRPLHGFSGLSGAIALSIMMIPIIIKNTEESLNLVPSHIKEAAYGLGAPFHKVVLQIVVPTALSGIVTGIVLATGRILGETAPLLFTSFGSPDLTFNLTQAMEAVPTLIFKYGQSPRDDWIATAWAASLILAVIVLLLNVGTRWVVSRWKH